MELLFSKFTLLIACLAGFILFVVYSTGAIRRHGVTTYFARLGRTSKAIVGVLGSVVASLVGFLAASTKTSDATEATANAARGGILNHRTGKFDDGTDPAGWYEND